MSKWVGFFVAWFLPGALAVTAFAQEPPASSEQGAQELVEDTAQRILAAVKAEKSQIDQDPKRLYELVDEIVLPHFDFRRMTRRALGKHWRQASRDQRSRIVEGFETLLVRTYATALSEYKDQSVKVFAARSRPDSKVVTVRAEVTSPGSSTPILLNYALERRDEDWKVFDVALNGVSLVINYRASFDAEVRQNGVDGLIKRLEKVNQGAKW